MKDLVNLLTAREKKTLVALAAALVFFLLFFVFVSLGEKRGFSRIDQTSSATNAALVKAQAARDGMSSEAGQWEQAVQDLEELRTRSFYDGTKGSREIRLDIERLMGEAGVRVSRINYKYADLEKGSLSRVVASFSFEGSYASLKKFLALIERFPKFLTVERIDFANTDSAIGSLALKMELAGYYEN
jgi:hypothetical protein